MPITLAQAQEARRNIASVALRTPLIRCNRDEPANLYLKLENLQPIGSFKIRGAANVMARTPHERLRRGVLTASAGNMAQGVAFCARRIGISATIIAPDTAPATKIRAVERMGGRVIKVPSPSGGELSRLVPTQVSTPRSSTPSMIRTLWRGMAQSHWNCWKTCTM